jgi:hypothetical protein
VPIPAPPITPNQVRWMEAALTHLRGTALTESEKLSTILLVSGLARGQAAMAADLLDTLDRAGGTDPSAGYGQALAQLADPAEFPAVHAAVLSGSLDDDNGDNGQNGGDGDNGDFARDQLRFGLELVLDGLAALVERRAAGEG